MATKPKNTTTAKIPKEKTEGTNTPDIKEQVSAVQETPETNTGEMSEKPVLTSEGGDIPPVTGDQDGVRTPEYRGQISTQIKEKQTQANKTISPDPQIKKATKADPYEELAKEYTKHYPGNDTFHITTDKQVFLQDDRNLAVLHQNTLKTDEKVHSITVKQK